jgi:hypothetical protein
MTHYTRIPWFIFLIIQTYALNAAHPCTILEKDPILFSDSDCENPPSRASSAANQFSTAELTALLEANIARQQESPEPLNPSPVQQPRKRKRSHVSPSTQRSNSPEPRAPMIIDANVLLHKYEIEFAHREQELFQSFCKQLNISVDEFENNLQEFVLTPTPKDTGELHPDWVKKLELVSEFFTSYYIPDMQIILEPNDHRAVTIDLKIDAIKLSPQFFFQPESIQKAALLQTVFHVYQQDARTLSCMQALLDTAQDEIPAIQLAKNTHSRFKEFCKNRAEIRTLFSLHADEVFTNKQFCLNTLLSRSKSPSFNLLATLTTLSDKLTRQSESQTPQ